MTAVLATASIFTALFAAPLIFGCMAMIHGGRRVVAIGWLALITGLLLVALVLGILALVFAQT